MRAARASVWPSVEVWPMARIIVMASSRAMSASVGSKRQTGETERKERRGQRARIAELAGITDCLEGFGLRLDVLAGLAPKRRESDQQAQLAGGICVDGVECPTALGKGVESTLQVTVVRVGPGQDEVRNERVCAVGG